MYQVPRPLLKNEHPLIWRFIKHHYLIQLTISKKKVNSYTKRVLASKFIRISQAYLKSLQEAFVTDGQEPNFDADGVLMEINRKYGGLFMAVPDSPVKIKKQKFDFPVGGASGISESVHETLSLRVATQERELEGLHDDVQRIFKLIKKIDTRTKKAAKAAMKLRDDVDSSSEEETAKRKKKTPAKKTPVKKIKSATDNEKKSSKRQLDVGEAKEKQEKKAKSPESDDDDTDSCDDDMPRTREEALLLERGIAASLNLSAERKMRE
jgi:hypothetical protein